jgi:hypothetical protein
LRNAASSLKTILVRFTFISTVVSSVSLKTQGDILKTRLVISLVFAALLGLAVTPVSAFTLSTKGALVAS